MAGIHSELWMVKYRPKSLSEIVLPDDVKDQVTVWIEEKAIPHLILIGPPGTGKTSLASVIINELDCEVLELNGSDERGIDTIREKVKDFARIGSTKMKIIFMDESDYLTADAQGILRKILEEYAGNTRFIFTGNYDKFIDPLKDRCEVIKFRKMDKTSVVSVVEGALAKEEVVFNHQDIIDIVEIKYPSIRGVFKCVQANVRFIDGQKKLSKPSSIAADSHERTITDAFRMFSQNKVIEMRKFLIEENFDDYTALMKHWFNNSKNAMGQLIVAEYMYRESLTADKEINFLAMCHALRMGAAPFVLHPEINQVISNVEANAAVQAPPIQQSQRPLGAPRLDALPNLPGSMPMPGAGLPPLPNPGFLTPTNGTESSTRAATDPGTTGGLPSNSSIPTSTAQSVPPVQSASPFGEEEDDLPQEQLQQQPVEYVQETLNPSQPLPSNNTNGDDMGMFDGPLSPVNTSNGNNQGGFGGGGLGLL